MKTTTQLLICVSLVALASCAPYIKRNGNDVIVSGGTLSSTQGFSGEVKTPDGGDIVFSIVGTDGTAVAAGALQVAGLAYGGTALSKVTTAAKLP